MNRTYSLATLVLIGCFTPTDPTIDPLAVNLDFGIDPTVMPNGVLETVVVTTKLGGAPASGISVALGATGSSAAAFVPASVVTGEDGTATAAILVPFDAALTATATLVTGVRDQHAVPPPILTIDASYAAADGSATVSVCTMVTVTVGDSTLATMATSLPLTFASATAGTTFVPSVVATDGSGFASSSIALAAGSAVSATVSGGGTSTALSLAAPVPVLDLPVTSCSDGSATKVTVTAAEHAAPWVVLPGLATTFALVGANGNSDPFTPVTAMTGPDGTASSFVDPASVVTPIVIVVAGQSAPLYTPPASPAPCP